MTPLELLRHEKQTLTGVCAVKGAFSQAEIMPGKLNFDPNGSASATRFSLSPQYTIGKHTPRLLGYKQSYTGSFIRPLYTLYPV